MPPLSAYTPFESLLFFQSLAASDAPPASFASISSLLSSNPFVRQHGAFNADRLSPEALEDLYATLMRDGFDRDNVSTASGANRRLPGGSGPSNPKKRKISSPRPEALADGIPHATLVPELVSHLYAKYRELVTKEIREDEKRYTEIRDEIERLQTEKDRPSASAAAPAAKRERAELAEVDVKEEPPRQHEADQAGKPGEGAVSRAREKPSKMEPQRRGEVNAPPASTHEAPGLPPPPAQPPQALPPHSQPVNGQSLPQPSTQPPLVPRPAEAEAAGKTGPAAMPPAASQRTPVQSGFQQWQLEPSHPPYPAVSPDTALPQAGQPTTKRPFPATSAHPPPPEPRPQAPFASTVSGTPGPAASAAQTPVPIGRPRVSQTPSATAPSFSESRGSRPRLSIDTPGSSTPWRRTPRLSIPQSPTSPARPRPEDVSPISERAPSPFGAMDVSSPPTKKTRRGQATAGADGKAAPNIKTEQPSSATRRKRAISSVSSQSRGRSVASRDESPVPREHTARESRASGRRKGVAAATDEQAAKGRSKRKRDASETLEPEPFPEELPKVDPARYVLGTRNFHRTAAPIMNDVATHKLASIFAKPLAERDAPGYHDLIYRPQDLKSIKSAIHNGSRAVTAATEAVSTPAGDAESPAPAAGTPSKNAVLMLQKSEDVLPPKGIVNSAQLEKELIRMFANAIMFNPIPERGFGPAFPMISDRGSRESTDTADTDEGGIIQDSLEMFDDVEQAVTRWRAAERTADELANKNVLSLRRGSASDFNTDSADDAKG